MRERLSWVFRMWKCPAAAIGLDAGKNDIAGEMVQHRRIAVDLRAGRRRCRADQFFAVP